MNGKMKVYVIWFDGEREFASSQWREAKDRQLFLEAHYGENRAVITVEYI